MIDVLLIEDDDLLRGYLLEGLEDAGYRTREAGSGAQGLKMIGQRRPDIVVTDLVMDDGEGIGTIMTLRDACSGIPLIAISGNPMYLDHAIKLGAWRSLLKPFLISELSTTILDLMDGAQPEETSSPA